MVETGQVMRAPGGTGRIGVDPVTVLRVVLVAAGLTTWEALAASGLLYRDVVPSLTRIGAALFKLLTEPAFYANLQVTALEVGVAMLIGGFTGLASGLILGSNRFVSSAWEPYLYYLAPTPKIIFFPVMIMWFGVGLGSKIAMGAISCYFPIVLSVAAGMRGIDNVLIRVGKSFGSSTAQMISKIYLPAMRAPVINGFRLGFGVAVIGVLLAETKLSNQGLGFMIIQAYNLFNMPQMYALLILVFALAIAANALFSWVAGPAANVR